MNKAAAGYGYDLEEGDEWEELEVVATPAAERADFCVEVEGDSMEPDYHNGDIVFVVKDPDVPVGKVGLFIIENKGFIKERGKHGLISKNPHYSPIVAETLCVGQVIGIAEVIE